MVRKRFVISDTHFFHKNILDYENRPWKSVEEMNKGIINKWNSVVKGNDLVYLLGDVFFCDKELAKDLMRTLKGEIHLILGNHDRGRSNSWYRDVGFHEVSRHPVIIDNFVILSHEPVYLNKNMPYANIHGHTHSQSQESKQYFNASVEVIDYTPVNLDKVYEQFKTYFNEN